MDLCTAILVVDELLEKATSITNETERFELYEQIQEIIWNECPAIWLYYEDLIVATKGGITNLVVLPFQKLELDNVVGLG
uniref:ABC transporter substrate-binding protein n=1 Tax=Ignisphaera aggregans TaxID=334771 RepID=A0A7C2V9D5_9CREN